MNLRTLLPRRYPITLHHHSGRTVEAAVWARNLEQATANAWRHGSFDNWEAVTITDNGASVRIEAPGDVAGWAGVEQQKTPPGRP